MIPTPMENLIDNFTTDERMSGFNQTYDSEDENASFHFRHWLKSDEELRVRVYVSEDIDDHTEYISAFIGFLTSYDFELTSEFEEIEDEYADYRGETAYETTVQNPYAP